jgi:hypothetical protein
MVNFRSYFICNYARSSRWFMWWFAIEITVRFHERNLGFILYMRMWFAIEMDHGSTNESISMAWCREIELLSYICACGLKMDYGSGWKIWINPPYRGELMSFSNRWMLPIVPWASLLVCWEVSRDCILYVIMVFHMHMKWGVMDYSQISYQSLAKWVIRVINRWVPCFLCSMDDSLLYVITG